MTNLDMLLDTDLLPGLASMDITDYFCRQYSGYFDHHKCPKLLRQEPLLESRMLSPRYILTPRGGRQIRSLIRALGASDVQVEIFAIQLYPPYYGGPGGLLSPFDNMENRFATMTFVKLKTLHLALPKMHTSTYEKEESENFFVTSIFQAAKNLEPLELALELALEPPNFGDSDLEEGCSWSCLFGTSKIGRLRKLSVDGLIVGEADLTHFLVTSCSEIQDLYLYRARLTDGHRDSRFRVIHTKLPFLNAAGLGDLFYEYQGGTFLMLDSDQDRESLYNYLCNLTQVNPWSEIVQNQFDIHNKEDEADEESEGEVEYTKHCQRRDIEAQNSRHQNESHSHQRSMSVF